MTVASCLRLVEARLGDAGIDSPRVEAELILAELLGLSRSELLLARERELSGAQHATLRAWLGRRVAREPLQHILGTAHFYGLDLLVTPEVLIPRPETERLVELGLEALRGAAAPRVLDVGTGSGAIALALKYERPDAEVWATDLSEDALRVAAANAERLGLELHLRPSDLLDAPGVAAFARSAEMVVSNPPYLPVSDVGAVGPEVRAEPGMALYSGPDGLDHFRRLARRAQDLMRPGAQLLLELDPRNVETACRLCAGWPQRSVETDLVGRKRFLKLRR